MMNEENKKKIVLLGGLLSILQECGLRNVDCIEGYDQKVLVEIIQKLDPDETLKSAMDLANEYYQELKAVE